MALSARRHELEADATSGDGYKHDAACVQSASAKIGRDVPSPLTAGAAAPITAADTVLNAVPRAAMIDNAPAEKRGAHVMVRRRDLAQHGHGRRS